MGAFPEKEEKNDSINEDDFHDAFCRSDEVCLASYAAGCGLQMLREIVCYKGEQLAAEANTPKYTSREAERVRSGTY